jgi:hypothetical protein
VDCFEIIVQVRNYTSRQWENYDVEFIEFDVFEAMKKLEDSTPLPQPEDKK